MLTAPTAPPLDGVATTTGTPRHSALPRWLPLAGLVALLAVVTRKVLIPVSDPDTWWHLRLGHLFREEWSLADPGQLTPFADQDWVPTQWLPEVVASVFEDVFGLAGVAWLAGAAVLVVVVVIYRNCRLDGDVLPSVVATALGFVGMLSSLSPRPHLVTYVLLAVATGAWLQTSRDLRARWWLIPLTWLWACSHGMWFTGVAVGGAVTLGLVLDRRLSRGQGMRLAAVPVLSLVAAGLTPVGPELLGAPFAVGDITAYISEWAPPSFRGFGSPLVTAGMAAVIVLSWARRGRTPYTHLAILALAAGWTLLSARTVTLGALMMAPLLASAMQSWLPSRSDTGSTRGERLTLTASLTACLAGLALLAPVLAATPAKVPSALSDELEALPRGTTVLNSYAVGGWLHWRHPDLTPTVDGLTESYGPTYIKRYFAAANAAEGWQWVVNSTDARHALVNSDEALATALRERLGWESVGTDEGYVLLRAPRQTSDPGMRAGNSPLRAPQAFIAPAGADVMRPADFGTCRRGTRCSPNGLDE